jgi:hypothetical protein
MTLDTIGTLAKSSLSIGIDKMEKILDMDKVSIGTQTLVPSKVPKRNEEK